MAPLIVSDLSRRWNQMCRVPAGEHFRGERSEWLRATLGWISLAGTSFAWCSTVQMLHAHRDGARNPSRDLRAVAALTLWDR